MQNTRSWNRTWLVCLCLGVVACGGGGSEEETTATETTDETGGETTQAEPETAVAEAEIVAPALVEPDAAEAPFVGHWRNRDVTTVIMTLNGAGRVRMDLGGSYCYGSYQVTDGAMTMTYDENQSGCSDFSVEGRVSDDGASLRFSVYTTYDRVDAVNEAY